jgi:hypothetical protein
MCFKTEFHFRDWLGYTINLGAAEKHITLAAVCDGQFAVLNETRLPYWSVHAACQESVGWWMAVKSYIHW